MKIELTEEQLNSVKEGLESLHEKERGLHKKIEEGVRISGLELDKLYSDKYVLNEIIKNGFVDTEKII